MTNENIVVDSDEMETVAPEAPEAAPEPEPEKPKIPPKFAGKSMEDVIQAYSELESEFGRRGNEVGQLRRLTDELLGLQQAKREAESAKAPTRQKITSDQLFDDPDATITDLAKQAADERAAKSDERIAQLELRAVEEAFDKKHPGFRDKLTDEDFLNFVRESSYRQNLIYRAAQNDWGAADELFIAYEDAQKYRQPSPPVQDSKVAQAKSASLVKSGGSSASGVVPRQGDGKKIYSRLELINMRIRNPEEFDARYNDEFLPAYMEGRVK